MTPAKLPGRLLSDVRTLILQARIGIARAVNSGMAVLYWQIGQRIRKDILHEKRAEYGAQIVVTLSRQLVPEFGDGFGEKNVRRMVQFAEQFNDREIVVTLSGQLGWSHFVALIPLEDVLKRDFYAEMCRIEGWSVRTLRQKIGGMLYVPTGSSVSSYRSFDGRLRLARDGTMDKTPTSVKFDWRQKAMLFFRYQPPDTLSFAMLRRGEIFFASPSELNDAHEFRPRLTLNGSTELWQRLAHYILVDLVVAAQSHRQFDELISKKVIALADPVGTALKKKLRSKDLELEKLGSVFVEAITPLLSEFFQKQQVEGVTRWLDHFIKDALPKQIPESHYVACFSLNATNPTMWGHYSNAEKGFVVIYSATNTIHVRSPLTMLHGARPSQQMKGALEVGSYSDAHLELRAVEYRRHPPKVNAFHQLIKMFYYSPEEYQYDVPDNLPGDAAEREEERLGLIKFSDWRYEREIRVFFPPITWPPCKCQTLCPDVRVLRVSGENVSGLIFGPKMSSDDKERAVACCYMMRKCQTEETATDFAFFQAEQQHNEFALSVRPVGLLDASFYHPRFSQLKPLNKLSEEQIHNLSVMAKNIVEAARQKIVASAPSTDLPELGESEGAKPEN